MITRRQALQLLGSVAATALLATSLPALAQEASVEELSKAGPLGDVAQATQINNGLVGQALTFR